MTATGTIMKQTFVVEGVNAKPKYGKGAVFVKDAGVDTWLNFSDKINFDIKDIEKGGTYTFEIYKADSGKKYINKVLDTDGTEVGAEVTPEKSKRASAISHTAGKNATVDWAAKDRSQLVGGRSHDAAELAKVAVTAGIPIKDVLATYKEALLGILEIADEVK